MLEGRAWHSGAGVSELAYVSSAGSVTVSPEQQSAWPPELSVNCVLAVIIFPMFK